MQKKQHVDTIISITARQLGVLLLITILGMRMLLLPSALTAQAGNTGYISFLFSAALTFLTILGGLYIISKNKNKNFAQILENSFGKIAAKIILFTIAIFFLYKLILTNFELERFSFEVLYENINWTVFLIPIFIVMGYVAFKGPRVMGRSGELFFLLGLTALVVVLFLAIPNIHFPHIMPFANRGFRGVFTGAVTSFTIGGEFLFLLILAKDLAPKEHTKLNKTIIKYTLVALTITLIFLFVFAAVLGYTGVLVQDAITKLPQFTNTYRPTMRLDGFTTFAWLPMIVLYSTLSLYCAAWCLKMVFNFKNFIPPVAIITLTAAIVRLVPFISLEVFINITSFPFAITSAALQILLPLSLIIITLIKNRTKQEFIVTKTKPSKRGSP